MSKHLQNAYSLGSMKPFCAGDWIPRGYDHGHLEGVSQPDPKGMKTIYNHGYFKDMFATKRRHTPGLELFVVPGSSSLAVLQINPFESHQSPGKKMGHLSDFSCFLLVYQGCLNWALGYFSTTIPRVQRFCSFEIGNFEHFFYGEHGFLTWPMMAKL